MKRVKTIITLIAENVDDDFVFAEGGSEEYASAVANSMASMIDTSQVDEMKVRIVIEDMEADD